MPLLRCEISIHAQPAEAAADSTGRLLLPADWAAAHWGMTFDDALAAVGKLPRLYTEPDGSLIWTSPPEEEPWQLCGCLYDRGPELAYVDLFGSCSRDALSQFLTCLRGPATELMVQLRERGEFVTQECFLRGPNVS